MVELIDIKLNKRVLPLFHFLKDNPTRTLSKGNHVILSYYKPPDIGLTPFSYKGITVKVSAKDDLEIYIRDGWSIARELPISYALGALIDVLGELEREQLKQRRQGAGLLIDGMVYHWLAYGVNDVENVEYFVKTFYKAGYSFEQVALLYSGIAKPNESLSRAFIALASQLYSTERS